MYIFFHARHTQSNQERRVEQHTHTHTHTRRKKNQTTKTHIIGNQVLFALNRITATQLLFPTKHIHNVIFLLRALFCLFAVHILSEVQLKCLNALFAQHSKPCSIWSITLIASAIWQSIPFVRL